MNEFVLNPTRIDKPRSVFPVHLRAPTTMKVGEITPLLVKEVLPGDTFSIDLSSAVAAASPFVSRVFGDLFLDVYAFFVPNRLVWNHWQQFCGENDSGAWTQTNQYEVPTAPWTLSSEANGKTFLSLGDHMGLPMQTGAVSEDRTVQVNLLPFRGYARIYNEWFRNENVDFPLVVSYGDSYLSSETGPEAAPMQACRFNDYFSAALPGAQKGGAVGITAQGYAPVIAKYGDAYFHETGASVMLGSTEVPENAMTALPVYSNIGTRRLLVDTSNVKTSNLDMLKEVNFTNLYADLSSSTAVTINQWRLAFQTQKYLELMARGGTRYFESLKSLFGVTNDFARMQMTEYLGGKQIRLAFQEVVATSSSAENSDTKYALGQQTIKSFTVDKSSLFTKSFTEHGFLHIYGVIRYKHQYCQGLDRQWTRKDFLDYYNPVFDSIGETPIYQKEIFCDGSSRDDSVFGYQEAWADYRYDKDQVTGLLRPNGLANSLSTMTFADNYSSVPTLGNFMPEQRDFVTRTLALQNLSADFICDFMFTGKKVRTMSVRSIPGLIDHH